MIDHVYAPNSGNWKLKWEICDPYTYLLLWVGTYSMRTAVLKLVKDNLISTLAGMMYLSLSLILFLKTGGTMLWIWEKTGESDWNSH